MWGVGSWHCLCTQEAITQCSQTPSRVIFLGLSAISWKQSYCVVGAIVVMPWQHCPKIFFRNYRTGPSFMHRTYKQAKYKRIFFELRSAVSTCCFTQLFPPYIPWPYSSTHQEYGSHTWKVKFSMQFTLNKVQILFLYKLELSCIDCTSNFTLRSFYNLPFLCHPCAGHMLNAYPIYSHFCLFLFPIKYTSLSQAKSIAISILAIDW